MLRYDSKESGIKELVVRRSHKVFFDDIWKCLCRKVIIGVCMSVYIDRMKAFLSKLCNGYVHIFELNKSALN